MTHISGVDRVGLAVEGRDALALAAEPRLDEAAGELGGVIDVQRPGAVVGDEVGDVDQGVDRAQADRAQPRLQPGRRGAVLHAADQPAGEGRAGVRAVERGSRSGRGRRPGTGATDRSFSVPTPGRGEVAGDAGDAQPVGPVRRHLEVDHRLQAERLGGRRRPPAGLGQLQDAVGLLGGLQLGGRAEHAVGDHAAHRPRLQRDAGAGDVGPDRRVDGDEAGPGVGRAADDLLAPVLGLDLADAQAVGVRVLHGLDDAGDREGGRASRPDRRRARPRARPWSWPRRLSATARASVLRGMRPCSQERVNFIARLLELQIARGRDWESAKAEKP